MTSRSLPEAPITRRTVLGLAIGAGAIALSGCSWGGDYTACDAAEGIEAGDLGSIDDVPVGSSVLLGGAGCAGVIVARPATDEVIAFRPICPHRSILVVRDGQDWNCPAPGARFAGLSGDLLAGPAEAPLPRVEVDVVAGRITPRST